MTSDLELRAIRYRAESGVIPYVIWCALPQGARDRLQSMSQTSAKRMLDNTLWPGEVEIDPEQTDRIDSITLNDRKAWCK